MLSALAGAGVAAVITSAGGWLLFSAMKRRLVAQAGRDDAEAAEAITAAAVQLVSPLTARIETVTRDLCDLQKRFGKLEDENRRLRVWGQLNFGRVIEMGGDPVPFHEVC